jgi:hypothetical protein
MYGDLSLEDVEDFEGLEPEDGNEIRPMGRFQRGEVRNFEQDFGYDLDRDMADEGSGHYEEGLWVDEGWPDEDADFPPNDEPL